METTVYTRSWAIDIAKGFSHDLFRSALFALVLLVGFLGVLLITGTSDEESLDPSPISIFGFFGLAALAFIFLVACCYIALYVIANDRVWGVEPPILPHVWDDSEARWISSTVSFAHYLEERGSHINATLVRYDDPRTTAHRLIDKVDDRTLELYLSLLSAVQMEQRQRVEVKVIDRRTKTLEDKPLQG